MGNTVVYQWMRGDGSPYYVGIGNPQRPYTGRRKCGYPPPKEKIVVLHKNLEWEEACEIEKDLIAYYGRRDLGTGILRNLTDGGDGTSGAKHSEETKKKISEANMGKKLSDGAKNKISEANTGKKLSDETKKKMSESKLGKNNPQYNPRDWYHPVYGEVLQKSTSDLIKMFPEQNLNQGNLSRVSSGKLAQHKGWKIFDVNQP